MIPARSQIDPRALRTYLFVCQENSISGAARRLNISQPAVSVTIAQLEETLDATLFERGRTGIKLTPVGLALKRRAEALEALLRDAREEIELVRHEIGGPIRIGGTPGALVSLIPNAVRHLTKENVRFALHVIERPDAELTELLRNGDIDLAVVTTGMEVPPDDLQEETIIKDPFSLVVGHSNDHLPSRMALPKTIDMRWLMPQAPGSFRRQIDALFTACDTPIPKEVIRCDSLLTTKAIIRSTDYVTIQPRGVVAAELSMGALRAIEIIDAPVVRNVGVRLTKDQTHRTAIAKKFLDAILETSRPRSPDPAERA
jgi:DNA-binding transcriptional LysR family regulator